MQEMRDVQVQSLGREDPLEEGMATHSRYSCLENPTDRGAWRASVHKVEESGLKLLSMHAKERKQRIKQPPGASGKSQVILISSSIQTMIRLLNEPATLKVL